MLVADTYLGHRDELADDLADALHVTLTDTERQRSRVRTAAASGTDLGIVVPRRLEDGDVLEADETRVVVSLETTTALVVDFTAVTDPMATLTLGHAAGNRHWNLAVEDGRAYFSVTKDRERMEAEVRPQLPDGATIEYEAISPALFDHSTGDHTHDHEGGHGHSHGNEHDHDHTHSSIRGEFLGHEHESPTERARQEDDHQ